MVAIRNDVLVTPLWQKRLLGNRRLHDFARLLSPTHHDTLITEGSRSGPPTFPGEPKPEMRLPCPPRQLKRSGVPNRRQRYSQSLKLLRFTLLCMGCIGKLPRSNSVDHRGLRMEGGPEQSGAVIVQAKSEESPIALCGDPCPLCVVSFWRWHHAAGVKTTRQYERTNTGQQERDYIASKMCQSSDRHCVTHREHAHSTPSYPQRQPYPWPTY